MTRKKEFIPTVLVIGGSDSSAGAGIQADLKTLWALDVYGLTVLTSVTAQDGGGVKHRQDLTIPTITAQIDAAFSAGHIQAVKIGMLGSTAAADAVFDRLERFGVERIVVDPVRAASRGGDLAAEGLTEHVLARRRPRLTLLTPNVDEAEALTGMKIATVEEGRAAAAELIKAGAGGVLITGILDETRAVDCFAGPDENLVFARPRLPHDAHGTGCTLSTSIAGYLARGLNLTEAVRAAGEFVHRNLADALVLPGSWRIMYHRPHTGA